MWSYGCHRAALKLKARPEINSKAGTAVYPLNIKTKGRVCDSWFGKGNKQTYGLWGRESLFGMCWQLLQYYEVPSALSMKKDHSLDNEKRCIQPNMKEHKKYSHSHKCSPVGEMCTQLANVHGDIGSSLDETPSGCHSPWRTHNKWIGHIEWCWNLLILFIMCVGFDQHSTMYVCNNYYCTMFPWLHSCWYLVIQACDNYDNDVW